MDILNNIDTLLFEMANLDTTQTGIKTGAIFISTQVSSHGCRIKYFPNLREQSKSLTVTIPELIIVDDNLLDIVSNKTRKEIVQFAKVNTDKLLDFWYNGVTWYDYDVTEFKKTLKLNQEQIKDSKAVTLVWK